MSVSSKRKLVFIDVETTCLDRPYVEKETGRWINFDFIGGDIIEIACIVVCPTTFEVIDEFEHKARPYNDLFWSSESEQFHGFSYFQARTFPKQEVMIDNFIKFLELHYTGEYFDFWYQGRNKFDYKFIWSAFFNEDRNIDFCKFFQPSLVFSTTDLAKEKLSPYGETKFDLKSIANFFGFDHSGHHRALFDTRLTVKCFQSLIELELPNVIQGKRKQLRIF
jgi:DNA polymerase III epsilon subunit-like protein